MRVHHGRESGGAEVTAPVRRQNRPESAEFRSSRDLVRVLMLFAARFRCMK
jgi:hypothetical protein